MEDQQRSIVIADDLRRGLEIDSTFFRRRVFRVVTAPDGTAALHLIASNLPDLAILSETLPGVRAVEICFRVKADRLTGGTRVLLVGSEQSEEAERAARLAGADVFVARSAGPEALLQTAGGILDVTMRRHVRITVVFTVRGVFLDGETLHKAIEISAGGLSLEVNRYYPRDSELELRFMLPGKRQEIRTQALVRWASPRPGDIYAMGLEFIGLSEADRSLLSRFIEKSVAAHESVAP